MKAYIVCEGNSDKKLLEAILPKELLKDVEIVAAGGLSAIKSLSRSLLVRRQVPVAIVADADSVDPDLIQERIKSIEELVKGVAVDTPVKVILAIPALEIIFFQDDLLLSRLLGYKPSEDLLSLSTSQPYQVLRDLLYPSTYRSTIDRLTGDDLDILRKAPVIQEIINFLLSIQETTKVS